MSPNEVDPDQYVRENKDMLVRILKEGDDDFVRALSLVAILRYGDEPLLEDVQHEIERVNEKLEVVA